MIQFYRIIINFLFLISPLIFLIRIIKKKNILRDLKKNLEYSLKKEEKVN